MPGLVREHCLAEITSIKCFPNQGLMVGTFIVHSHIPDPSGCGMERWRRSSLPPPCLHPHHRTFPSPGGHSDLSTSSPADRLLAALGGWLCSTAWWIFLGAYVLNLLERPIFSWCQTEALTWASFHGIISKCFLIHWCCFYLSWGFVLF